MEERKVVPDEKVIQQGDDGDNFYVIERFVLPVQHNKTYSLYIVALTISSLMMSKWATMSSPAFLGSWH